MSDFSYGFSPRRSPDREFVRILKRIGARLARLPRGKTADLEETVHDLRQVIKLLRALLWFAKPVLHPSVSIGAKLQLRHAAQLLAAPRDRAAMQSTLEDAAQDADRPAEKQALKRASHRLLSRPGPAARLPRLLRQAVSTVRKTIRLLIRNASSAIDDKLARKRLDKAFKKTSQAHKTARKDPTPTNLHQWRKKAKRLLYLLQLLRADAANKRVSAIKRVDKIQQTLGDYHDSVVLQNRLVRATPEGLEKSGLQPLFDLLEAKKIRLRKKAEKKSRRVKGV